ncbi:MAG: shikimate dehydrogenase, partial [Clostridia bacterium]|nr:shikimate dehydrogenase [Clostridia bacterium]
MKYGLIGEKLGHSFSKEIHERLGYDYELCEVAPEALDGFMKAKNFEGINVTIPYKQAVIPYLDEIDEVASEIGAVNTIVNRDGKLYGYNTDFYGMERLF